MTETLLATLIGGGLTAGGFIVTKVSSWVGGILGRRNERQSMRRYLYKEIANNYGLLQSGLDDKPGPNYTAGHRFLPEPLHKEYYEYAKTRLELFNSLEESYHIDAIYNGLERVAKQFPDGLKVISVALDYTLGIETMLMKGLLDAKVFMSVAQPWVQELTKRRIKERQEITKRQLVESINQDFPVSNEEGAALPRANPVEP